MATSPVPLWVQEMSPHHRGPTTGGVLALAVVVVLVMLALSFVPTTHSGAQVVHRDQGSLCDAHRGDPAWTAVCKEASHGR